MAAIPVVLNGVFTSDTGSTTGVFQGTLAYSDRAPGGGPIVPDGGLGIWGPTDPRPTPPIANVPGAPGYRPPSDAHPEHPIYIPEPPTEPPTGPVGEDGFIKSPPAGGGWAYHPTYQWMYDAQEGVDPTPKG